MAHLDELDQRRGCRAGHAGEIGRTLRPCCQPGSGPAPARRSSMGPGDQGIARRPGVPGRAAAASEGPGSLSLLPVEEPTAAWPWKTAALEEILDWFRRARAFAPPGLRDYVADAAGESSWLRCASSRANPTPQPTGCWSTPSRS